MTRVDRQSAMTVAMAVGAIVFAAGAFAYAIWPSPGPADSGTSQVGMIDTWRVATGEPAPDFALIDARDGSTVRRLSDFRGKTVVLNWYASWCGPCRAELPEFERAFRQLNGDLVFLAVNLQESRDAASGLLDRLDVTFPAVLDTDGSVANHYGLRGMPTTFFIDRDGVVFAFGSGMVTESALRSELGRLGHQYE